MIRTILLTGATGFIGSHLLEALIKEGYNTIILKRSSSDVWRIKNKMDQVISYDLDKNGLTEAFEENKIDCVIHLATHYIKQHKSQKEVKDMMNANIVFPTMLLETAIKHHVKYFLNTGTFFEYGLNDRTINSESSALAPYNFYAATKTSFENHLKYHINNSNMKGATLRLFAPYGEKDNEKLILFLLKNLGKKTLVSMSPGEQRWNFTYVADIVKAYLKTLDHLKKTERKYDVFNIGSDKAVSIKDTVKALEAASGKTINIKWGGKDYSKNEILFINCDPLKAKNILGWKPEYDIKKGLKQTYRFYRNKTT